MGVPTYLIPHRWREPPSARSRLEYEVRIVGGRHRVTIRAPGNRATLLVADTDYEDAAGARRLIEIVRRHAAAGVEDWETDE